MGGHQTRALDGWHHRVLKLLTDGLAGGRQEVVRGAHEVVGAETPLVGGCAGDGLKSDPDYDARSLGSLIPRGGPAWFMEGDDDSTPAAKDAACAGFHSQTLVVLGLG